ncbi:MAG: hypothetical protein QW327_03375, partial [Candidatus Odinarchaeota archaeon]
MNYKNLLSKLDQCFLFLTFPVLSFLISSLWTALLIPADITYFTQLLPEYGLNITWSIFYATIFIIIALVSAFIIYYLIEKNKELILKYLLGFCISFVIIIILPMYTSIILGWLNLDLLASMMIFSSS